MNVTKATLKKAVDAHLINDEQAQALYQFLISQPEASPSLNLTNVLYYLGGMIAIGAMTLFMNLGWEAFGGFGIFALSLLYAVIGLSLTAVFNRRKLHIPAGICATFVICLTPLAIYGFQVGMGWWAGPEPYRNYHSLISWRWLFMEMGTLISGLILAWFYRYPFMIMPIAVTLWYMSMDVASMLTGGAFDFELSTDVSFYFGLLMILLAFYVDLRSRKTYDYAFWLYLFGVLTFWGGLTCQNSSGELGKLVYCFINVGLIGVGVVLLRRVFVVFGAIGITLYLGHLADALFKNSVLFPIILSAIGFLIIYLGLVWQKNEQRITQNLRAYLPTPLHELLDKRRGS